MRSKFVVAFSFLLLLSVLSSCGNDSNQSDQTQAAVVPHDEVYDITGNGRRLDEWIGKQPVVLNFWGTWCGPCRREMPELVRLYGEYAPKGVEMIGLAVNDRPDRVKMFSQQYGMRWVMLMADKDILVKYRVIAGVPQTIFLDKNGREVNRFIGVKPYGILKQGFEAIL